MEEAEATNGEDATESPAPAPTPEAQPPAIDWSPLRGFQTVMEPGAETRERPDNYAVVRYVIPADGLYRVAAWGNASGISDVDVHIKWNPDGISHASKMWWQTENEARSIKDKLPGPLHFLEGTDNLHYAIEAGTYMVAPASPVGLAFRWPFLEVRAYGATDGR